MLCMKRCPCRESDLLQQPPQRLCVLGAEHPVNLRVEHARDSGIWRTPTRSRPGSWSFQTCKDGVPSSSSFARRRRVPASRQGFPGDRPPLLLLDSLVAYPALERLTWDVTRELHGEAAPKKGVSSPPPEPPPVTRGGLIG